MINSLIDKYEEKIEIKEEYKKSDPSHKEIIGE